MLTTHSPVIILPSQQIISMRKILKIAALGYVSDMPTSSIVFLTTIAFLGRKARVEFQTLWSQS